MFRGRDVRRRHGGLRLRPLETVTPFASDQLIAAIAVETDTARIDDPASTLPRPPLCRPRRLPSFLSRCHDPAITRIVLLFLTDRNRRLSTRIISAMNHGINLNLRNKRPDEPPEAAKIPQPAVVRASRHPAGARLLRLTNRTVGGCCLTLDWQTAEGCGISAGGATYCEAPSAGDVPERWLSGCSQMITFRRW